MSNINQIEVNNVTYDIEDNATRTASKILATDSNGKIVTKSDYIINIETNVTVPTSSWVSDQTYEDYPYKADISIIGISSDYFASICFDTVDALSGKFCPVAVTGNNVVTIFSVSIPTTSLLIPTITYYKEV